MYLVKSTTGVGSDFEARWYADSGPTSPGQLIIADCGGPPVPHSPSRFAPIHSIFPKSVVKTSLLRGIDQDRGGNLLLGKALLQVAPNLLQVVNHDHVRAWQEVTLRRRKIPDTFFY